MSKKQFILDLCKAISRPVKQYSSGGGYTTLWLKNGTYVEVYCDRHKCTNTVSLKLKFRHGVIGQAELEIARFILRKLDCKVDIYESQPNRNGYTSTVLRIRTQFTAPWEKSWSCRCYRSW